MRKNSHPIFIASKGRADACHTYKRLKEEGCEDVFLVVEPQDLPAYRESFPEAVILELEENDRGVSYVRNAILEHVRKLDGVWFWMLDDDIKEMYLVVNSKVVKTSFLEVIAQAEDVLTALPIAVGAMEYQQYAWAQKKPVTFDSYCDVAVLVNVPRTKHINYRDKCKEDRDFVLQNLAVGQRVARSTWTAFSVPKNGSNKGGLHEAYASGLENHWSRRMIELWPGVCVMNIKPDGRPDVKINWKKAKPGG